MVQILSVVLAAPVLEEILYRGLIMKSLQRGMPVFIALIIQAVLFGLMHGQLIWVFYATFLGVLLGYKIKVQISISVYTDAFIF